jgi:SAM-dependent methyltransferase
MSRDPTERFGERVEDYVRWRPGYPEAVVRVVEEAGLLPAGSVVADLGSGTGLLARVFLDAGYEVLGVEPNDAMRRAGEQALSDHPSFRSVAGRAERTGLADRSVDVVVAGQAFHWFEPRAARTEALRICRRRPAAALIWNLRRHSASALMEGYDTLVRRWSDEGERVTHQKVTGRALDEFFGNRRHRTTSLDHHQVLDREGLRGRLLSSSYAPSRGDPRCDAIMVELDALFERCRRGDTVEFLYETRIHLGDLVGDAVVGNDEEGGRRS